MTGGYVGGMIYKKCVAITLLLLMLFYSGMSLAADSVEYKNVTIKHEPLWMSASGGYFPVVLRVGNAGPQRELRVEARIAQNRNSIVAGETFSLPASSEVIIELPMMQGVDSSGYTSLNLSFRINGERFPESLNPRDSKGNNAPAFIFFGEGKTKLEDRFSKETGWDSRVYLPSAFAPELACRRWQSYMGLHGVVVVDGEAVAKMLPVQRESLVIWVRSCGGILWIADNAQKDVARQLGFSVVGKGAAVKNGAHLASRSVGMGRLWLSDKKGLERFTSAYLNSKFKTDRSILLNSFSSPTRRNLGDYYSYRLSSSRSLSIPDFAYSLLSGLNRIPVFGYCLISVLLGLFIGPLNFWYLRRRRKLFWFYFTAPLMAFIGVGGLAAYSVSSEGLGVKYTEFAMLAVDAESGEGAVYQARGIYSGLSVGELRYPARTLATAFRKDEANLDLSYDPGTEFVMRGSWVMPRSPSGVITMTLATPRMGLRVRRENDKLYVYNGFNYAVRECWVSQNDSVYHCTEIAAGAEKPLVVASNNREMLLRMPEIFLSRKGANWSVIAKMESLPYLEDGGKPGRLLEGEYWYVLQDK